MEEFKIGNTPLVELKEIERKFNLSCRIYAKVESYNYTGSVKARAAYYMIKDAEEKGLLKKGATIIEPTSGNTGIAIAAIGVARGYRVILTMPETMSVERRQMMAKYGAEIQLTDGKTGMNGSVLKAKELNESIPGSIILGQFDNPANVRAHYETTGPEIYKELGDNVDYFVAGIGTGGTIVGTGKYLKEKNTNTKVIAVEPLTSPLLSKGYAGGHKIQGIGANFIPSILDRNIYDEVIDIDNDDAFTFGKLVRKLDNLSVGISSGAALKAAVDIALREDSKGKNIVVIFPDSGDRYLSTPLFQD